MTLQDRLEYARERFFALKNWANVLLIGGIATVAVFAVLIAYFATHPFDTRDDRYILRPYFPPEERARVIAQTPSIPERAKAGDDGVRIAYACNEGMLHIRFIKSIAEVRLPDGREEILPKNGRIYRNERERYATASHLIAFSIRDDGVAHFEDILERPYTGCVPVSRSTASSAIMNIHG